MARQVGLSALADALGVGKRTVQRWHTDGKITPAWTTPGGQYRWDVEDVRRQLGMTPGEQPPERS